MSITLILNKNQSITTENKIELADKPGSVEDNHSSGINVTAYLKRPTRSQRGSRLMGTYLVLLRVGFTMPLLLPVTRCALTAPFHPYLCFKKSHRRSALCCTFRRLTPPRCYLAHYPMEPGLSSAIHPFQRKRTKETLLQRLPGQLGRKGNMQQSDRIEK